LQVAAALALPAMYLLLNACSAGQHHTSDSKLERNFLNHEGEFEALLSEVQADEKLMMINAHRARYADRFVSAGDETERVGLTRQRWARYQRQLQNLGLAQITKGLRGDVEFRVDQGSLFNGDSYKGYEYSPDAAEHPKASLDGYRISESDRDSSGGYYVSKPLKGFWRLYLYVNG
jgi:hypothetical protein